MSSWFVWQEHWTVYWISAFMKGKNTNLSKVPLLPNLLFTSLHALLGANGVALIVPCKIPGRREELLSLVGAGMFQHLALCCHDCSSKKVLGNCFFVLASSAVSSITSSVTEEQSAEITVTVIKTFHMYYCSSVGNLMTKCEKKE